MLTATRGIAQGPPPNETQRAELIKRYDTDGDGKLSPDELDAMRRARAERRKSAGDGPGRSADRPDRPAVDPTLKNDADIQQILERFDADGNGKLNDDEMAALRTARRQPRAPDAAPNETEQPPPSGDKHEAR